jgi:hypothetical protein
MIAGSTIAALLVAFMGWTAVMWFKDGKPDMWSHMGTMLGRLVMVPVWIIGWVWQLLDTFCKWVRDVYQSAMLRLATNTLVDQLGNSGLNNDTADTLLDPEQNPPGLDSLRNGSNASQGGAAAGDSAAGDSAAGDASADGG